MKFYQEFLRETQKVIIGGHSQPTKDRVEDLSPQAIFDYIKKKFGRENITARIGKDKMSGYVLLEIEGKDVVIAEKFFRQLKRTKELLPVKNAATYFVHKDADIDLEQISLGELVERKSKQEKDAPKLIDSVNHRTDSYYNMFNKKFNKVELAGQQKATNVSNSLGEQLMSNNPEGEEHYKQTTCDDNREEDINDDLTQSDIQENFTSDHEATKEETKEEQSNEQIENSEDPLFEMLEGIRICDEEHKKITNEINEINNQIEEIKQRINQIKSETAANIDEFVTTEMTNIIFMGLQALDSQKKEFKRLEQFLKDLQNKEKENRDKRTVLANLFKNQLLKGDE